VNPKAGFGFANALRAILRHDPDVILVGEMRDAATAEMAVQAALTGHLVLSTLHTTDAASAVVRLTDMGIPPYLIAATLQGVLAQRLIRLTCQGCGTWQPLEPKWQTMAAQQLPADAPPLLQQRIGAGCLACRQTGYQGRAAITEFLPLDESVRRAIVDGVSLDALRVLARRAGVPSLTQDGWRAVREGHTTVMELVRVLTDADAS
jgi:type II secretory ATPase GspE/PulE/Tfp pilus assembly ATPase PilB-like protein